MKTVCVIPARCGSKRLPWKNVKELGGIPVICYSIATAVRSQCFDDIIVSTDCDEIAAIAFSSGASVFRRDRDDDGSRGTQEVTREVILRYCGEQPIGWACCLYPIAPLVKPADLLRGRDALLRRFANFSMAVGTNPLRDIGAFYWGVAQRFVDQSPLVSGETALVPIPEHRCCDVNTAEDWAELERKLAALQGEKEPA
jgi:pseudaminic acid cytidylyltransferase